VEDLRVLHVSLGQSNKGCYCDEGNWTCSSSGSGSDYGFGSGSSSHFGSDVILMIEK